jgi:hypothetical protein
MKTILLTQGKIAIVDDSDYDWLNQRRWSAKCIKGYWYAGGGYPNVFMHRVILNVQ